MNSNNEYISQLFGVKDKVCVITGGGGILCGHLARVLARAGAHIAVLGRTLSKLEKVVMDIEKEQGSAIAVTCDVLNKQSVEKAFDTVMNKFKTIDVLINGAGGASPGASTDREFLEAEEIGKDIKDFFNLDTEAFHNTSDLNFIGTIIPTQVFAKLFAEKQRGTVINISSMGAEKPLTRSVAYSAGKAAISNFTMWLAVYLSHVNIRVNAIAPGFFLTEQNRFLLMDEKSGQLTPRGQRIINKTPQRRFGTPEDLVTTLLWLISDHSAFVTGTVIPVDGGFSAYGGV